MNNELKERIKAHNREAKINDAMTIIFDELNIIGSENEIADIIAYFIIRQHRTLQQDYFRVLLKVIDEYSKASYDIRNEDSINMCKDISNNNYYLSKV